MRFQISVPSSPWLSVQRVARSCAGGSVVDRKKITLFLLLFFSVSVLVQNIQIQKERENWKKLCFQLEIERAQAALPLVVTMVPVVLSAIVAGTAIGWTQYNANGKQAWLRFTGAVKNGVSLTKSWIQGEIAELNGIDTSDAPNVVPESPPYAYNIAPSIGDFFSSNGQYYEISNVVCQNSCNLTLYGKPYSILTQTSSTSYNLKVYAYTHPSFPNNDYVRNYMIYLNPTPFSSLPSGFNPDDYQYLYTGNTLTANCKLLAEQYPDIRATYELSTQLPAGVTDEPIVELGGYLNGYIVNPDGTKVDINSALTSANTITGLDGTVYDMNEYQYISGNYIEDSQGNKVYLSDILTDDGGTITYSNGTTVSVPKYGTPTYVDTTGNVLDSIPSDVSNHLGLDISQLSLNSYSDKYIATGQATADTSDDGRKLLPGWIDSRLKGSGIDLGAGSTIKGVSKDGRLDWVDSSGVARTTLIDSAFAESLINQGVAVRTVVDGKTTYTQTAATSTPSDPMEFSDPGTPSPPPMGSGDFDPSFDWGEEDEFDVDYWKGVLGSLPLVALLNGSQLQLSTSNPVLSIPLPTWPGGGTTLTVDFSQYETLFNLMGGMIYFFALIYSISLALLGRGL